MFQVVNLLGILLNLCFVVTFSDSANDLDVPSYLFSACNWVDFEQFTVTLEDDQS